MRDRLGQIYFSHEKHRQFLDMGVPETADYSNATAEEIDAEISSIITKEYARAIEILKSKKSILEKGTALLLEKEKIEGPELKALVAGVIQRTEVSQGAKGV
jgi:cell division protease FtsH